MPQPTINSFTTCPTDCDEYNILPALPAEMDCTNYTQERSQVHTIYFRLSDADGVLSPDPFTNFATTPTATANAIDNTVTDNTKSKFLVGEGGVAEPTETSVEYPKLNTKVEEREYQLTFNVKQLTAEVYAFMQQLQCGDINFRFYYASGMGSTQYAYGISGGIIPKSITVTLPKGAGRDDRDLATIRINWLGNTDPDRRINPIS